MPAAASRSGPPAGADESPPRGDRPARGDRLAQGDSEFLDALANGLAVLELFGPGRAAMTINEAAEALGITRAGARRILLTLASLGFLDRQDRHFVLTSRVLDLGFRYFVSNGIAGIARPAMRRLCEEVGESVYLTVLEGTDTVVIARIEADSLLRLHLPEGTRMPAYIHSGGRILLAGRTDEDLRAELSRLDRRQLTSATLTQEGAILAAVAQARRDGYALTDGEMEEGLSGLAVPIRGRSGAAVAALSFCVVNRGRDTSEIRDSLLASLLEAARDIADLLARTPHA